jgi:hypothetical protein
MENRGFTTPKAMLQLAPYVATLLSNLGLQETWIISHIYLFRMLGTDFNKTN